MVWNDSSWFVVRYIYIYIYIHIYIYAYIYIKLYIYKGRECVNALQWYGLCKCPTIQVWMPYGSSWAFMRLSITMVRLVWRPYIGTSGVNGLQWWGMFICPILGTQCEKLKQEVSSDWENATTQKSCCLSRNVFVHVHPARYTEMNVLLFYINVF